METKVVCLKDGCLWLNGWVCSKECKMGRRVSMDEECPVIPPAPGGDVGFEKWFGLYWGKLRRFYGREPCERKP